jgi:hypothetical protein
VEALSGPIEGVLEAGDTGAAKNQCTGIHGSPVGRKGWCRGFLVCQLSPASMVRSCDLHPRVTHCCLS